MAKWEVLYLQEREHLPARFSRRLCPLGRQQRKERIQPQQQRWRASSWTLQPGYIDIFLLQDGGIC